MFIALVIAAIVLAAMCVMSAAGKLRRDERVVTAIHGTVGVPFPYFPVPAALELAGGAGVLVGLWLAPLGIAAAGALVAYFIGAIISHLRVGDTKGLAGPVVALLLSAVVLVLRIVTA